jgi:hypothetical protein
MKKKGFDWEETKNLSYFMPTSKVVESKPGFHYRRYQASLTAIAGTATLVVGFTRRWKQALCRILGDVGEKMQIQLVTAGEGHPVGIEYGTSRLDIANRSFSSLFQESLICQASLVVLFAPHFGAAATDNITYRLPGLVPVDNCPVLMDKHDREWKIVPKDMEVS